MAAPTFNDNILTEEFLIELYHTGLDNDYIFSMLMEHFKPAYLPDRDFQAVHRAMLRHYKEFKKCPTVTILRQALAGNKGASSLFSEISDDREGQGADSAAVVAQMERYIRQVRFQKAYKEAGEQYNKFGCDEAFKVLAEYTEWADSFKLGTGGFVNIVDGFSTHFKSNRQKHNAINRDTPVTRFYIDELDERNHGRNLRGQLTCFLASTGVGKSHIARWIGKSACMMDGLNVLHFQLEGSEEEVINAYSASFAQCPTFNFENGLLKDADVDDITEMLKSVSGTLHVKSYPKFNSHVSTVDIYNGIQDFKKQTGISPDIVIIDSMDLLTDSSGRMYTEKGERLKRIAVANDLKDLAADENVWIVVTYQSTIESQELLDDENRCLTIYNTAEAKGLTRPLTHLITLNQSSREERENTMRLHVAKSRFFKKGQPFRIATDYEHETFYDRQRTMALNKVNRA